MVQGTDAKPLPTVKRLRKRILGLVVDLSSRVEPERPVAEPIVMYMAGAVEDMFSLSGGTAMPMLRCVLGVPYTQEVSQVLIDKMERWIPALRAGYSYTGVMDRHMARIPHTVQVFDPTYDPDTCKWEMTLVFLDGPLMGTRSGLQISHRMSCAMLASAVGVRKAYGLDFPRPYDLHELQLLIQPAQVGAVIGISKLLKSSVIHRRNKAYAYRFETCMQEKFDKVCFDCGAGTSQCPMARHSKPLTANACRSCGKTRVTTGKGVCILCLEQMVTLGVPMVVKTTS